MDCLPQDASGEDHSGVWQQTQLPVRTPWCRSAAKQEAMTRRRKYPRGAHGQHPYLASQSPLGQGC